MSMKANAPVFGVIAPCLNLRLAKSSLAFKRKRLHNEEKIKMAAWNSTCYRCSGAADVIETTTGLVQVCRSGCAPVACAVPDRPVIHMETLTTDMTAAERPMTNAYCLSGVY
jgi:hypothetical protein